MVIESQMCKRLHDIGATSEKRQMNIPEINNDQRKINPTKSNVQIESAMESKKQNGSNGINSKWNLKKDSMKDDRNERVGLEQERNIHFHSSFVIHHLDSLAFQLTNLKVLCSVSLRQLSTISVHESGLTVIHSEKSG